MTHLTVDGLVRGCRRFACFVCTLVVSSAVQAQPEMPPADPATGGIEASAPATPEATPDVPAEAAQPTGEAPDASASTADAEADALIAVLEERAASLEQKAEEAEMAALLADDGAEAVEDDPALRIYGFADFGVQRAWAEKSSPVANFIEANATSFVIGNLNLYFDAKPADKWRTLIEVHLTNAPHGLVNSPGGLAGTFDREDTYQIDPHGSGLNVPLWRGSIAIERAWAEWQAHQLIKVRVGNYFTPWGIWNIDHGSPTLITLNLPQMILQYVFPIRQTGIQLYGSAFFGEWQLGYHATLSNGRNEVSNFDFNDGKALGGRLFLRRETGAVNFTLGASGYMGSQQDEQVDLVGINPLTFEQYANWRYKEELLGFDVALDIDDFRVRTELTARNRRYDADKREEADPLFAPLGSTWPSQVAYWAYLVVAQRLPWLGLEPYLFIDGQHRESSLGDTTIGISLGLNVHFTPATLLKLSYYESYFLNLTSDALAADLDNLGVQSLMARVVTAF